MRDAERSILFYSEGVLLMYSIVKDESRKGWGYVRDYIGNTWFYGPLKECKEFISQIEEVFSNEVIL